MRADLRRSIEGESFAGAWIGAVACGLLMLSTTAVASDSDQVPADVQRMLARLEGLWQFQHTAVAVNSRVRSGCRLIEAMLGRRGLLAWTESFDDRPELRITGMIEYAANRGQFLEIAQLPDTWPELHLGVVTSGRMEIVFAASDNADARGVLEFKDRDRFEYRREVRDGERWLKRWEAVFAHMESTGSCAHLGESAG